MLLKCVTDFIMEDGEISFSSGTVYDFFSVSDEWYTGEDDQRTDHQMHVTHLLTNFVYIGDPI